MTQPASTRWLGIQSVFINKVKPRLRANGQTIYSWEAFRRVGKTIGAIESMYHVLCMCVYMYG